MTTPEEAAVEEKPTPEEKVSPLEGLTEDQKYKKFLAANPMITIPTKLVFKMGQLLVPDQFEDSPWKIIRDTRNELQSCVSTLEEEWIASLNK